MDVSMTQALVELKGVVKGPMAQLVASPFMIVFSKPREASIIAHARLCLKTWPHNALSSLRHIVSYNHSPHAQPLTTTTMLQSSLS